MRCVGVTLVWMVWTGTVLGRARRPTVPPEQQQQQQQQEAQQQEVYCECVPYYICQNGVISTSGIGIIDTRTSSRRIPVTNVENCPGFLDICCGIPPWPTPSTSTSTSTSTTNTTSPGTLPPLTLPPPLPPDTPCSCVTFFECPPERLVSDGLGNTTLEFLGFSYSHSLCQDSFSLCCAIEPTPTPVTAQCECVEPHLCDENGIIIIDGQGLLDLRRETPSVTPLPSGGCSDAYFVCCRLPGVVAPSTASSTSTITPITTTTSTTSTTTTTTTDVQLTTDAPDTRAIILTTSTKPSTTTNTSTTTTQEPPVSCGIRNSDGIAARIVGFLQDESQFGEFPWVAAVLNRAPVMGVSVYRFVGGGTLIHPRVVLTAAHKLKDVSVEYMAVRVGEWDTQKEQEPYPHQDIAVESVLVHPLYYAPAVLYDVALLFLEEEVVLGPHVNTLCLADNLDAVDPSSCVINGWGVNTFDMGEYQQVMKSLTVPLVPRPACVDSLRRTRLGPYFHLHPTFLCAGGEEGKDACKGDGGGPLACPMKDGEPGQYLLVGITAWGIGCGQEGVPGVYVNVPYLHSWITATVRLHLLATTTTVPSSTTTCNTTTTDRPE